MPEAYKYRNYVIDSFNKDKPYDQFIREQLAGDLLPHASDDQRWEQTIGTGYLAISRRIEISPQNLKHIMIEDTINQPWKDFHGINPRMCPLSTTTSSTQFQQPTITLI